MVARAAGGTAMDWAETRWGGDMNRGTLAYESPARTGDAGTGGEAGVVPERVELERTERECAGGRSNIRQKRRRRRVVVR